MADALAKMPSTLAEPEYATVLGMVFYGHRARIGARYPRRAVEFEVEGNVCGEGCITVAAGHLVAGGTAALRSRLGAAVSEVSERQENRQANFTEGGRNEKENDIRISFNEDSRNDAKIKVIGVGGGGTTQ